MNVGVDESTSALTKSQSDKPEKKKVNQSDLPLPPDVNNALEAWQQKVVPTYIAFIGSLKRPWDANSTKKELKELQRIWSKVFPTSDEIVEDGGIIHKVVSVFSGLLYMRTYLNSDH